MNLIRFRIALVTALAMICRGALRGQILVVNQSSDLVAQTRTVDLAWEASSDTNVIGYYLCWGLQSGDCTNRVDLGNVTNAVLAVSGTATNFYLTTLSYDALGQSSRPSNEVRYSAPAALVVADPLGLSLAIQRAGGSSTALRLSFRGESGATYQIEASGDLQHWDTLWLTNCSVAGLVLFLTDDPASCSGRFYRLIKE